LQVDGSPHHWLEGRGPPLCLIGAIDDATGKVVGAMFVEAESTWGYFRLFSEVFSKHGLPQSVYADRHSSLHPDIITLPLTPDIITLVQHREPSFLSWQRQSVRVTAK